MLLIFGPDAETVGLVATGVVGLWILTGFFRGYDLGARQRARRVPGARPCRCGRHGRAHRDMTGRGLALPSGRRPMLVAAVAPRARTAALHRARARGER